MWIILDFQSIWLPYVLLLPSSMQMSKTVENYLKEWFLAALKSWLIKWQKGIVVRIFTEILDLNIVLNSW